MKHDPLKHQRRSIRLRGYDYAAPGAYFVTICTRQRQMFFDQLELRQLAETCWREIPAHAARVELDEWVVMPNHIHGLIVIVEDIEAADKNIDDRGRGVQSNAPTVNTLDAPMADTLNVLDGDHIGRNTGGHGTGVHPCLRPGCRQLNAPTTNTLNVPTPNTLNAPTTNTLNGLDGDYIDRNTGGHGGTGVHPCLRPGCGQLNAPTMNALNAATPNTLNAPAPRPREADNPFSVMSPRRNSLSVIVRTYKAAVTTACRAAQRSEFAWQRGFYEHVVRNPSELAALRRYVRDNPLKWALDRDNSENTRRLPAPVSMADYLEDLVLNQTP